MQRPHRWLLDLKHDPCLKTASLLAASLAFVAAVGAAEIGPWPATQPYLWLTNPITPVCGTVAIAALDVLQMSGFTSGTKTAWLPYTAINGGYTERMCLAQLWFNTNSPVTNIHVRIYDPLKSGKSGWAVIPVDSSGRIFDFGIRGYFASAQIIPHQYNGSSWANYDAGTQTWNAPL